MQVFQFFDLDCIQLTSFGQIPQRALGSLVHYITHAEAKNFQPANITFDLLEPLEEEMRKTIRDKKERHTIVCERALAAFDVWWAQFERELRAA